MSDENLNMVDVNFANVIRGAGASDQLGIVGVFEATLLDPQGNIVVGTKFKGGPMPVRPTWSADWPIQIPRIAGLPGYTDELAMRLLTQGAIRWDGKQLRAPMPRFRMSPQDAADVIAYLRSLSVLGP